MAWFNIFSFIVQTITSIPSALASTKELTSKHSHGAAGAEQAYDDFMTAATTVIYRFRLMAELGVPPPITGGLWTFPAVFRSSRVLTDATKDDPRRRPDRCRGLRCRNWRGHVPLPDRAAPGGLGWVDCPGFGGGIRAWSH